MNYLIFFLMGIFSSYKAQSQPIQMFDSDQKLLSSGASMSISGACTALEKYPVAAGKRLDFEKGKSLSLCHPFWYDKVKTFQGAKMVDACDRNPKDINHYLGRSRKDLIPAEGEINIHTREKRNKVLEKFLGGVVAARNHTAEVCCGSKTGQCYQQVTKVPMVLCDGNISPNNWPSSVSGGAAALLENFERPGKGFNDWCKKQRVAGVAIYNKIYRASTPERVGRAYKAAFDKLNPKGVPSDSAALKLPMTRKLYIRPLARYGNPKELEFSLLETESIVRHETAHVCENVKANLGILGISGDSHSGHNHLHEFANPTACKPMSSSSLKQFEVQFSSWKGLTPREATKITSCLKKVVDQMGKNFSLPRCDGYCANIALAESYAQSMDFFAEPRPFSSPIVMANYCLAKFRGKSHPPLSSTLECWLQHSKKFRDRMKRDFNCTEPKDASETESTAI